MRRGRGEAEARLGLDGAGWWWPCCQHEAYGLIPRAAGATGSQGGPWADVPEERVLSVGGGTAGRGPSEAALMVQAGEAQVGVPSAGPLFAVPAELHPRGTAWLRPVL